METTVQKRIFEALVKAGKVEQPKLEAFLKKGRPGEDANIVKRIAESGLITEKDFLVVMSKELNIPPIDLSKVRIEEQVAKIIPEKIAKQYHMVAVSRIGDNLTLAIFDPTDILALDDVRTVTRCELSIVIATKPDILSALQNSSTARKDGDDGMSTVMEDSLEDSSGVEVVDHGEDMEALDAMEKSKTAPIVKMVAVMITEAIKKRASDIHIEPQEKSLKVRYRVDGELFEAFDLPKKNQNAIIARVKIMSNMDITENRIPQDGRFRVKIEGREIDFRVSVLPTIFGNKVVMRALDKTNLATGLDMLGFLPEPLAVFKTAMSRPYGIILVTGPTGSGKSTTLYSVLNEINVPEKNIVTVEDPVEYQVAGITQLAVQQEIGLDFATGLRSILRQSPDVILIGEIRDHETADIAIKSSLTGHLVLSTLHTNDSVGSITRLKNMGVEPFLVASSMIMACAQRLMRRICLSCKTEVNIPKEVLHDLTAKYPEVGAAQKFYEGKGCSKCNNTGYHGRIAILEAMLMDDAIRDMINRNSSEEEIKKYLKSTSTFKSLRQNAIANFCKGITTLEEVFRAT